NVFGGRFDAMFAMITAHEETLAARFVEFLTSKSNVRLLGPKTGEAQVRTPTFSFTVQGQPSAEIATRMAPSGVAIGQGNFYAPRLLQALGITEGSVLRASMVHYNTVEEVDRLIAALDEVV
ncbi:MAG: aminotransferase class V-fold PLP-dependent enzyme, partial [Alphaproteobacteria bacterium]|nr:aminotransferase class V-fold PLP-dependent enzyme [Alphaproteobacteria bacterium]